MAHNIRITSGWGFASSFSEQEFQELATLADGLELMVTSDERFEFFNTVDLEMESASLHLQALPETKTDWYYELKEDYPIECVVVHASDNENHIADVQLDIPSPPLAFENLDGSSDNREEALMQAKDTTAMFNIDIQHLSETRTIPEAQALIDVFDSRIAQFHISGRKDDVEHKHSLVTNADNRGRIISLLEYITTHHNVDSVPWVIEGKYETIDELNEEINFLTDFKS